MKKWFIGLLVMVIGVPIALIFALTDSNYQIPYESWSVASYEDILEAELNSYIRNLDSEHPTLETQEMAFNNMLFNNLRETQNPNYFPADSCDDDGCKYIQHYQLDLTEVINQEQATGTFGLTGVWMEFEEDSFTLHFAFTAKVLIELDSRIQLTFDVESDAERFLVTFQSGKIGRTPVPKALITSLMNQLNALGAEFEAAPTGFIFDSSTLSVGIEASILPQVQAESIASFEALPYPFWLYLIWSELGI